MKGTTIRTISVSIKLLLVFIMFSIFMFLVYDNKQTWIFCNIINFILSIITFAYCMYSNYFEFRNEKPISKIMKKIRNVGFKKDDNFPIYYLNEDYKNYLLNLLDNISNEQKDIFKKKGYVIVIGTPEELKEITKTKYVDGLFSHHEKYILLYLNKNITKQNFESTFYHEWRHFVDYCNHYISNSIHFIRLFLLEKGKINNSLRLLYSNNLDFYLRRNPHVNLYEMQSSSEFFASNYSKYKRCTLNDKRLIDIYKKTESHCI